ncbi:MAG: NADH-quinone oxidoreductase subunit NuoF [Defluviitaleaceae bacterium]|nr:NADH-quinone oxidoreductase subunit NuoF [Defluviitaleaceae bacterium]
MKVFVGRGSCGNAAGASEIFSMFEDSGCDVRTVGCVGMCYLEPIVDVQDGDGERRTFVKVDEKVASEIIKMVKGEANNADANSISKEDIDILKAQKRIALLNCGVINPDDIEEYIAQEGYSAVKKAVTEMTPEQVIAEIKVSGLAGRGGAGFPTWFKWNAARNSQNAKKYMICNADEGDPGAFMDRAIIEGDPHVLIEGMMIGAYAIGSDEGIVYVRAEYPLAIIRLEHALNQAREKGILGNNIFGSGFSFDIRIKAGAGAFVCGEETALIASLEGERGMPRLKPPFPAQKGYWGKPSNINNVETFANVPWIIKNGGTAYSVLGTENSKGTKVFALTGKIAKGGLVEVPMGISINDIIFNVGGGIKDGKEFKAVQMGGPSGGCIPKNLGDTQVDYASLAATGAIMGSGGMVVMDETTCMVDMARFFLDFTRKESCGKCTHCRIGTDRMLKILERICDGNGLKGDIETLEELSVHISDGALCALGQTAANPVLTTIRYFRNEYEDHITNKKCTAVQCKPLINFSIDEVKCTGCTICARKCPVGAITGELKKVHTIDTDKCDKCGVCKNICKFDAVEVL